MTYKLTRSNKQFVLVSDWAPEGARYTRDSVLPHIKGQTGQGVTGTEFVREQLLKPGGDASLGCDEPDQLIPWAWDFLTSRLPREWVQLAELYYELRSAGVKLPKVVS